MESFESKAAAGVHLELLPTRQGITRKRLCWSDGKVAFSRLLPQLGQKSIASWISRPQLLQSTMDGSSVDAHINLGQKYISALVEMACSWKDTPCVAWFCHR